jgi:TetR/AcrR family transcriptional repressor of nem operon
MNIETRAALLKEAEFLVRTRGYSAFSYADLAQRVQIAKASVHHHFPKKEDLITALVSEYVAVFVQTLARIASENAAAADRLTVYARLFLDGLENGMLPLCGALSAERAALPESLRASVRDFFQLHLDWLSGVVEEGVAAGDLRADAAPREAALMLLSALEGGSLVGWALERNADVLSAFAAALRSLKRGAQVT